jgi:hypothetical protein
MHFLPLLFNFASEYAIRKVQENQVWKKLNETHRLLAYADNMNLPGDDGDTIKKNTETLTDANKEAVLEINTRKSKYMLLYHHKMQGSWHNDSKQSLWKHGTI